MNRFRTLFWSSILFGLISCANGEIPTDNILIGASRDYQPVIQCHTNNGITYFSLGFECNERHLYCAEEGNFGVDRARESTEFLKSLGHTYIDNNYFDACVSEEVKVISNLPIAERQPGDNLIDLLLVTRVYRDGLMCSFPDIKPVGFAKPGMLLGDYLAVGCILPLPSVNVMPSEIQFAFDDGVALPDSFTLSIDIPIHGLNYADKPWEGGEWTYIDKVLHCDVDVNTK